MSENLRPDRGRFNRRDMLKLAGASGSAFTIKNPAMVSHPTIAGFAE